MNIPICFFSRQRHRNIVAMLGLCTDNKLPYIMSEFIEGFTVKSYIQNKGELMSWPLRLKIVSRKLVHLCIFNCWEFLLLYHKSLYSWLSLSRIRLTRISGWVEFLSKSRTSLCINIYNLTPVESNSDESKFRLSRIKVLVPRCKKPYYLHSLSQIYLSKHVYYLRIKIGSQVKHPVIEFDIFTLGYFTCLFHNLSN